MTTGIVCPHCGLVNHPQRRTCHQCRGELAAPAATISLTPLEMDARRAILDHEISTQVGYGWRVATRTNTAAQLVKDKHASGCVAILLFCLAIVPGLIYLALARGHEGLYIEVNEYGEVRRTLGS
jgi:hypothetical protein